MAAENPNPQTPKLQCDPLSNAANPEVSHEAQLLQSSAEDDWCLLMPSGD